MAVGRSITYVGVDGARWHLHGVDMGAEGVYLTSLAGFYFPVSVPLSQQPAYMRGAKPGPSKIDPSVIDMKLFTSAETEEEWEDVESAWWRSWSTEEDGTLIATDRRGRRRTQPVRLQKWPSEPFDFEPETEMEWTLPTIAYSPGWRGPQLVSRWQNSSGSGSGVLRLANPGDIEIWPQIAGWGQAGVRVTVPDGIGGTTVRLTEFADGEHWLVDPDMTGGVNLDTVTNTQAAARMAGLLFQYPIPPHTVTPVDCPVSATGADTDTEVAVYMTPLHMRPWG
ncbi:hypothetical protein [Skermania piniformis]|uniref:Phage tail protein n=1 Tax=Skermania pinensis TaxID=39122 RepID=A0ABX8SD04_9ACTN|nr:hypothetical protein [Skermania piniformis]QXQ14837.1 hypothetical protein KV203_05500 [Skermania piniformis]